MDLRERVAEFVKARDAAKSGPQPGSMYANGALEQLGKPVAIYAAVELMTDLLARVEELERALREKGEGDG